MGRAASTAHTSSPIVVGYPQQTHTNTNICRISLQLLCHSFSMLFTLSMPTSTDEPFPVPIIYGIQWFMFHISSFFFSFSPLVLFVETGELPSLRHALTPSYIVPYILIWKWPWIRSLSSRNNRINPEHAIEYKDIPNTNAVCTQATITWRQKPFDIQIRFVLTNAQCSIESGPLARSDFHRALEVVCLVMSTLSTSSKSISIRVLEHEHDKISVPNSFIYCFVGFFPPLFCSTLAILFIWCSIFKRCVGGVILSKMNNITFFYRQC